MSTIPSAIILQSNFLARIESDSEKFLNIERSTHSDQFIESIIRELEEEFVACRDRHDKIIVSKSTDAKKYIDDDIFDSIRIKYHTFWAFLKNKLPSPSFKSEEITHNSTLKVPQCKQFDLKLPRLGLPTFNGDYDKWLNFNNLFTSLVHNNTSLDPIQKLQYLNDAVSGDAKNVIKNLELNDENYNTARTLLLNRFNHTRRLVNSYFKLLFDYPKIQSETAKNLKLLVDNINDCTSSLKQLKVKIEDYQLIYHMLRKLPTETATSWEKRLGSSTELPEFSTFITFLEDRYRTLEMVEPLEAQPKKAAKVFHSNKTVKQKTDHTNQKNKPKSKKISCILCKGEHSLGHCDKFTKLPQSERFSTVKNNHCCINCLDKSHQIGTCWSTGTCRVCKKKHHTLLHRYNTSNDQNTQSVATTSSDADNSQARPAARVYHTHNSQQTTTLFGTAQLEAVNEHGTSIVVRALIDPCSEDNFILASTVNTLSLPKYYEPSNIEVVGNQSSTDCSYRVKLIIRSIDGRFYTKLSAGVVDTLTSDLPSIPIPAEAFGFLSKLTIADPGFNKPGRIELLLGIGFYTRVRLEEFKRYGQDLVAENTLLGYIIRGTVGENQNRSKKVFMTQSTAVELNQNIQKFWKIEELEKKAPIKPEDELCEQIFLSTIRRESDGRLSVDLPFRDNIDPSIGPSRYMAEKRFLSLEKKFNSNKYLKEEYHKQIRNYLDLNHLIKVPRAEQKFTEYYLPHHAVYKESSTTTKVRVVFDASCKSLDGTSLNDHLLTGPKLQVDIKDILFNWRQYPIALTADIEKMYRMFNINKRHHDYQKIVWRFEADQPLEDYVLTTATFGTSCAPYLAIRCLQFISENCKESNPVASNAILKEFYVDDFISGAFSVKEASNKQTETRSILDQYQLSLRKWSSNERSAIANIPTDLLDSSNEVSFDETDYRKTLGIYWSKSQDSFFFSINTTTDSNKTFTKRQILSLIARLYDPLGWVAPCTMYAKQLMQRIWQTKLDWDDPVDDPTNAKFKTFLEELQLLKNFKIPRWTNITDDKSKLKIIGFCDASDKGYGAVLYLVDPKDPQEKSLILLSSKTRVADLKFESTARLELNGAVLLSDLLKWAVQLYKPRNVDIVAYCDSKIVLAWLNAHPSKWKTYIANRTTQILEWMNPSQWNYVNTSLNPADFASRGMLPSELINNSLWINGPNLQYLHNNNVTPLSNEQNTIVEQAIKKNSLVLHTKKQFQSPFVVKISNHFTMQYFISSLTTFIRNICNKVAKKYNIKIVQLEQRIQRLKKSSNNKVSLYLQKIIDRVISQTTVSKNRFEEIRSKLRNSERVIFRLIQSEQYSEEIMELNKGKNVSNKSVLKGLHPFIDKNGILRVGGRLDNSDLNYNQRHPIILPSKHLVTSNIIRQAHLLTLHGTELLTSAYLRHKYHIPRLSEKIRNVIHHCNICFKFLKQNQEQLMGSLPTDRVNFSHPFQHTGVDYAGPITIKCYPGRCKKFRKGYIALFVCLCTKAIHIELASDLTSQAYLAAFRRFVARRGRCHKLYSDNGTNFVGAKRILEEEIRLAEKTWKIDLDTDFKQLGTEWHFNPPATPHFGGIWEAGVKSVKSHLKKTVGASLLTFEELNTILVQIEGVLNSRPLCPMSNNPNEYNFLTPAHFLIGRPIICPPEKSHDIDKLTYTQRWNHLQVCFQRFAKLWRRDYLQRLQNRPKCQKITQQFKVGDLVLVTDDDTPPTIWPTAIIKEIHPGKDKIVRVVTLKTASGKLYKRPVVKLRYLPCNVPFED